ncbi:histidine--tRNA ligase [Granulicella sp. L46]|uniref:histidine--tRNA ligase n=1 Tax=Granulicella sp. L46 TaxID=1641865 RepID=UPI00131AA196|nr:histidine--tRNA ligase [Granulicella sp. L46]
MTESKKTPARPTLKAVRGTRDLLPDQTPLWNHVEATARALFARYGFGEIRTPIFETTELFARGVGEETDIVSKEMFTWEDRARAASEKAQSLTLRPESTAGVVRAYIEHKLGETGQLQKLYYIGPQFRRERPQRGRYRQFWQIGAEVIGPQSSGSESPLRDAEILEMLASFLDELGIRDWRLELNSVGSSEDRVRYNAALREALQPVKHLLCEDNQRRAETNPLRVLDSKDEADQDLINALPKIADYLGPESAAHFAQVLAALDACGVPYNLNPRLVRGLDYYTRTTFEFTVTTGLGTQNALLGGGRYDGLSEMLGGPKAPGIGFAIGEDRLILTLQAQAEADAAAAQVSSQNTGENPGAPGPASGTWVNGRPKLDAYITPLGVAQNPAALALARELRAAGLTVEVGDGTFKLRKSFDIADTLARHIILLGEDEVSTNIYTLKTFSTGEQIKLPRTELFKHLAS